MKRKLFLALIAVLVICLTCGMLLVACNNKDDNGGGGGGGNNPGGGTVVPPVTAKDIITDAAEKFDAVAKDTTGDKEFNLGIELVAVNENDAVKFALVTETIGGKDYIYGSVNGGDMMAFNGFDLGGTIETVLSWFGGSIMGIELTPDGFMSGIVGLALSGLVSSYQVSENGDAYQFVINLENVLSLVVENIDIEAEIEKAGLTDIMGTVASALNSMLGLDVASPATVTGVLRALATDYKINIYFGFGEYADKASESASVKPFGDLALSDKVVAARPTADKPAKNLLNFAFDGTAELKDAEGTTTHTYKIDVDINLDIFQLIDPLLDCVTVTVDAETGSSSPSGFVVTEEKLTALMDAISKLGYISIEVNEMPLDGGADAQPVKNVLTIHSNFDEGNALVQLFSEKLSVIIVSADVALGGVYDFDALAGFIFDSLSGAITQAEGEEGGINVMGLITSLLGLSNLDINDIEGSLADINANGFSLTMSGLVDTLAANGLDLSVAADAVPGLWHNAETMTIKISTPLENIYGSAVKKNTADLAAVKYNSTASSALVSDVKTIDINSTISGMPSIGMDVTYNMTGTPIGGGDPVSFEGYIVGISGLDISTPGTKTATLYVAPTSLGESLVSLLADFVDLDMSKYPVFGIIEVPYEFEVITQDVISDAKVIGSKDTVTTEYDFSYSLQSTGSMKTPFELLRKSRRDYGGYTVGFSFKYNGQDITYYLLESQLSFSILDENGTAVSNAINADGDITVEAGNYILRVQYGSLYADIDFNVSTVSIVPVVSDQGTPVLGEQYNYGINVVETMPDGTTHNLTPSSLSYRIGSTSVNALKTTFDAVGTPDGSNMFLVTLDKLTNSFGDHYVSATVTSTNGAVRISSIRYDFGTVATPDTGLTATTKASFGFGESVDNQFTITVSGQKYTLHWTGSAWQAVYADGDNQGDVNSAINAIVELNWREKKNGDEVIFQGTPVTLSAQGYITNNPVTNGASNMQNVDWKVTVGDMSTTGNFSVSPIYSNNTEKEVGDSHSITASPYVFVDGTRRSTQIYWDNEAKKYDIRAYSYANKEYTYYYHADFDSDVVLSYTVKDASNNDVTATVFDAEGKYAAAGEYTFTYTLTFGDVTYTFTSTATITAPTAEA